MTRRRQRQSGNTRRGADFWRAAMQRRAESDMTLVEFCDSEGLAPSTFSYWRRKLLDEGASARAKLSLVPIEIVPDGSGILGSSSFEVVLRSGHLVRVPPSFDEDSLMSLVFVLESASC